jgi:magnesium-transporting ATPase (P-type)
MKAQRIVSLTFCLVMVSLCVFAVFTTTVMAQEAAAEEPALFEWKGIARDIILVAIFSIVGLIILMVGYKVFDMATPYDLNRQIAEENNTAAGIAVAGVLVSLGIIVAAAMG